MAKGVPLGNSAVGEGGMGVLVGRGVFVGVEVFVGEGVSVKVEVGVNVGVGVGLANKDPRHAELRNITPIRSSTFIVVRCIE